MSDHDGVQLREKYGHGKYVPTDLRYKKTRAIRRRLTKNEVSEECAISSVEVIGRRKGETGV